MRNPPPQGYGAAGAARSIEERARARKALTQWSRGDASDIDGQPIWAREREANESNALELQHPPSQQIRRDRQGACY